MCSMTELKVFSTIFLNWASWERAKPYMNMCRVPE